MNTSVLKNIHELPALTQPLVAEFADKLLHNLGENVVSIMVYGSAAGANYNHGISNINLAVVVKNLDFPALKHAAGAVKSGRKHKIAVPLFLAKDFIAESLDVFPIEFCEIKQQHKVIFGEDIFKDLEIPFKDVRLLCEQQIKGKLLHLRQVYLETGPNPGILKNLLLGALNDLVPIFRQMIVLKGQKPIAEKEQMFGQMAKIFALGPETFLALHQDKSKKAPLASYHVEAHFQNFLDQLEHLSRHMDAL